MSKSKRMIVKRGGGGPRTAAGLARSSSNAIQHGLFARRILTSDEDAGELEAHVRSVHADLKPRGYVEQQIVDEIAHLLWRTRRQQRCEQAWSSFRERTRAAAAEEATKPKSLSIADIMAGRTQPRTPMPAPNKAELSAMGTMPASDQMELLLRIETSTQRQLDRALTRLHNLQDRRSRHRSQRAVLLVRGETHFCETNSTERISIRRLDAEPEYQLPKRRRLPVVQASLNRALQ